MRGGGIAELGGEFGDACGVDAPCFANPHSCFLVGGGHRFHAAFRRRRACTAALRNSRRASAAIQRADREFRRRIRSAARIAARFRRKFRFPMFRSAQFTALRTKFLSSRASRSITRKKRWNLASEACLSL